MNISSNIPMNFTTPNFKSCTDLGIKDNFSATLDENATMLTPQDLLLKSTVLELQKITKSLAKNIQNLDNKGSEDQDAKKNTVFLEKNNNLYSREDFKTNIGTSKTFNTFKEKDLVGYYQYQYTTNHYKEPDKNNVSSSVYAEFSLVDGGSISEAKYIKYEIIRPEGTQVVEFKKQNNNGNNIIMYTQKLVPNKN
jgi:hypothetical protein